MPYSDEHKMRRECVAKFAELTPSIKICETKIDSLTGDLKKLTGNGHRGAIASLEAGQAEQKTALAAMHEQLDDIKAAIDRNDNRIVDIISRIGGFGGIAAVVWMVIQKL